MGRRDDELAWEVYEYQEKARKSYQKWEHEQNKAREEEHYKSGHVAQTYTTRPLPPKPRDPSQKTFFDLPGELRNRIYEMTPGLVRDSPIKTGGGNLHNRMPAITWTCQQLRTETLEVFYGLNTFQVASIPDFGSLVANIPRSERKLVRSVRVAQDLYTATGVEEVFVRMNRGIRLSKRSAKMSTQMFRNATFRVSVRAVSGGEKEKPKIIWVSLDEARALKKDKDDRIIYKSSDENTTA